MAKFMIPVLVAGSITLSSCDTGNGEAGSIILYSGRSEELVQPLIDRFEAETGIAVEPRYGQSPELAATLTAEGDRTEADIFFAQDPASLGSVDQMLEPLPEDVTGLVDARYQDHQGRWVGISGRVRTFIYHLGTDLPLPQTIDDVTDPAWAGQLGVAPTNGSFLAFVSAMILERGEEATSSWLHALAANEPLDYPSNSPIVVAADAGEIEGGLVNHYYLLRLRAEGAGDNAENWFIPAGDVGTLIMTAGAGILSTTDHREEAIQFIEFLLSEESQTYFATETFEYPLTTGVAGPAGAPALDDINAPDVDLSELAGVLDLATQLVADAGLV